MWNDILSCQIAENHFVHLKSMCVHSVRYLMETRAYAYLLAAYETIIYTNNILKASAIHFIFFIQMTFFCFLPSKFFYMIYIILPPFFFSFWSFYFHSAPSPLLLCIVIVTFFYVDIVPPFSAQFLIILSWNFLGT